MFRCFRFIRSCSSNWRYRWNCETCENGVIVDNDQDNDGYCDLGSGIFPEEILGCTEDWADNYDEFATDDDESCELEACAYHIFLSIILIIQLQILICVLHILLKDVLIVQQKTITQKQI